MIHKMVAWRFFEAHQLPLHGFAPEMFIKALQQFPCEAPQWEAADAEIKVPSGENKELLNFSL